MIACPECEYSISSIVLRLSFERHVSKLSGSGSQFVDAPRSHDMLKHGETAKDCDIVGWTSAHCRRGRSGLGSVGGWTIGRGGSRAALRRPIGRGLFVSSMRAPLFCPHHPRTSSLLFPCPLHPPPPLSPHASPPPGASPSSPSLRLPHARGRGHLRARRSVHRVGVVVSSRRPALQRRGDVGAPLCR